MGLERCSYCGIPIYVRAAASWNDDGTVTGRYARRTRVVQVYADEINHVLSGIGDRIGLDIGRIVVEGERKAAVQFSRDLMASIPSLLAAVFHNRVMARPLNWFLFRSAKNAGLGDGKMLEYRWGRSLVAEFSDPFNVPILAGDILGTVEAFYGKTAEVSWEQHGSMALIKIATREGASHVTDERLRPVLPPTVTARVELDRCPRCGIPLEVSRRYSFDLRSGIATEVSTERRIVTVIIDSLYSVFKELANELGEEIPRMIVDLESEYIMENAPPVEPPLTADAMRVLLGDLAIKGMGNPVRVSVPAEGELEVRIDNPFSEELLAGRVLGYFRALRGGAEEIEWTPDTDGFTVIRIRGTTGN
jgi:hypothetical protein